MTRRTILRTILWSLAVAAAAGVLSVLFADHDILSRVMWTGLTTAAAALLSAPFSFLLDRKVTRRAALLGLSLVSASWLLTLVLIWASAISGFSFEFELAATIGMLTVTGVPAILFLQVAVTDAGRWAGWAGVISCAAALVGFLTAIWLSSTVAVNDDDIWITAWSIGGHGVLLAASLVRAPRGNWWRRINLLAVPVSLAYSVLLIWRVAQEGEVLTMPLSFSLVVAASSLLMLVQLKRGQAIVRAATIATFIALAMDINAIIVFGWENEFTGRLAGALSILASCGTLATIVFIAINRRGQIEHAVEDLTLSVTCPRCQTSLKLSPGRSACSACGLRFRIRVEEPTCLECGYLLYGGTSSRCPECGSEVKTADAERSGSTPQAGAPRGA